MPSHPLRTPPDTRFEPITLFDGRCFRRFSLVGRMMSTATLALGGLPLMDEAGPARAPPDGRTAPDAPATLDLVLKARAGDQDGRRRAVRPLRDPPAPMGARTPARRRPRRPRYAGPGPGNAGQGLPATAELRAPPPRRLPRLRLDHPLELGPRHRPEVPSAAARATSLDEPRSPPTRPRRSKRPWAARRSPATRPRWSACAPRSARPSSPASRLGLSHAEVAKALGKPSAAAAHMAVSRALMRLAEEMAHDRTVRTLTIRACCRSPPPSRRASRWTGPRCRPTADPETTTVLDELRALEGAVPGRPPHPRCVGALPHHRRDRARLVRHRLQRARSPTWASRSRSR